jgi:hypothetical protein
MVGATQDIPIASRWSILNKNFGITEEEVRKQFSDEALDEQLALLPTEDEKQWMKIWQSKAKGLGRIQRKMAVCLEVEVTAIGPGFIEWDYEGRKIRLDQPKNVYKVSAALEFSKHHGIAEMFAQGCVTVDGRIEDLKTTKLELDELQSIAVVANLFFFQIYR